MAIAGPFFAGANNENSKFSFTFSPTVTIPSGALVWCQAITGVTDDANVFLTDDLGNEWFRQSFVQLPGTGITYGLWYRKIAADLTTASVLTMNSDQRGSWGHALYYHTGAQGSLFSAGVEYFQSQNPSMSVRALPGMSLFGNIVVQGPGSDSFTNDPTWSAAIKSSASNQATLYACGRTANVDAQYSYAPTLGSVRKNMIFAAAFK